jgi:acyl-CoA thioester hydrolase
MLPVIEAHTEYKKGAVFGQDITVHTTIAELPKVKMKFNYKVTHLNSDEILMTGHTIHAFTNLNSRPIKVPDYIKSLLERHMNS